ncbi:MAG: hypothetical protein KKC51_11960, partial [Verrucomicrobia bacterium]|nr:hypothetical protein [Verrucomicrobiota bacterium]
MTAQAGTFVPAKVTDQTPTSPLLNPDPATYEPRYISGFGSNNTFTVFWEDRRPGYPADNYPVFAATTINGPTGFPTEAAICNVTDTHFCAKAMPVTVEGTNYAYRAWGAVGNIPQHRFYVANDLTNWRCVSTFTITNATGFNPGEFAYYGFHDVLLINGTYYAWGEGNGGGTLMVRSPTGKDDWEAFARVGGDEQADGPLWLQESPIPSGAFIDLGYNRGLGKVHVRKSSGFYLAINTACRANLSPAEFEAAFTNVANWTWDNGTTGLYTNTTPILSNTTARTLRECWVVPNADPDGDWVIVYNADFKAVPGATNALGFAKLTPPPPGPVHNVTKDLYYDRIQLAVDEAGAGDVLRVAAGTYRETVTISKSLNLLGAQAGVDPRGGARTEGSASESIIDGQSSRPEGMFIKGAGATSRVTNVLVDGFEIHHATDANIRFDFANNVTV